MSAPRLLVIDHDPSVQRAVEATLGAEGCEVTAVGDGLTALDVALATTPDLILADYRMEGTNIFRFLEKLKQKNVLKNVALLLLVSPGDVYDELTLRLVGVTDFLRKPLNPKEMIDRVKRYNPVPTPVSAAPTAAAAAPAEPAPGKIEDLLGWSQDAPSPFSELSQDRSAGFDFSLPSADTSSGALDTTQFLDRNELTPTDHPTSVNDADEAFAGLPDLPLTPETDAADSPPAPAPVARSNEPEISAPLTPSKRLSGTERGVPPQRAVEDTAKAIARNVVEKVAWDVLPGLAKQSLERVVNEVVERIVWDVVPSIAEAAIKKEIERLTRDNG
ncbi:MAG: response regulator [Nitrospirota bacterium]